MDAVNFIFVALGPAMLLVSMVYLFLLENKLYVKKNKRMHWVFFAIASLLSVVPPFLAHISWMIPAFAYAANISFMIASYTIYGGKIAKKVFDAIQSHRVLLKMDEVPEGNVVFRDAFAGNFKNVEKLQNLPKSAKRLEKIYHNLSWERKLGRPVPSLMHVFRFRMSGDAEESQYKSLELELSEGLPEYIWTGIRDGKWYRLMAYPVVNPKSTLWKETIEVSKALPWYVIPLGVKNDATYLTKTNSMFMLKLHGTPSFVEQSFDLALKRGKNAVKDAKSPKIGTELPYSELLSTKELESNECIRTNQATATALVVGGECSGKSNVLAAILAHMALKPKVHLYVYNPHGNADLDMLNALPQVKFMPKTLAESYEAIKHLLYIMTQRYNALGKLNIKSLPLSGVVNLGTRVAINGTILGANERVHIRIASDEKDIFAQDIQPGMEVVIAGDKRFRIPNHWEFATNNSMISGGEMEIPPVIFAVDDYRSLVDSKDVGAVDDELKGIVAGTVSDGVMASEIKLACEAIAKYGHRVNVHMILANRDANEQIFPISFRDSIDFRCAVGSIDHISSNVLFGNDEGMNVGEEPGVALSSLINHGKVDEWRSLLVSGKDVLLNAELGKNLLKMVKNGKIMNLPRKMPEQSLRFDRYERTLPEEMAKGVVADYGFVGQRRETPKMDGESVELGGREINLNGTSRYKEQSVQLGGLFGDLEKEKRIGINTLPNVPDLREPVTESAEDVLTIEEILQQAPDKPCVEDAGRVDEESGVKIIGDQSSLNSYYSDAVDDEGDPFQIVK